MNTCSTFLVRVVWITLACAWFSPCAAQGNEDGLTTDFKKLSPKERSKIAAQENQEAPADSGYQRLMQQADVAFRAGHYEDALAAFQEARAARPYNVYPKVKIQDLQALIKKRDQELSEQKAGSAIPAVLPDAAAAPPSEAIAPPATSAPPSPASTPPPKAAPTAAVAETAPTGTTPLAAEKITVPPAPATPAPATPPSTGSKTQPVPPPVEEVRPLTIGERIYMEAGATVIERTTEDDGRPVVYKKVVHPWGQTFHFKDGLAISEREWNDRFRP